MRRHEPRLLLLAIYSTVIGMVTEVEVLRAFGEEPTARSLVRRRNEILELLALALLVTEPGARRRASVRSPNGRPCARAGRASGGGGGGRFGVYALVASGAGLSAASRGIGPVLGGPPGLAEPCSPSGRTVRVGPTRLRPGPPGSWRRLLLDLVRAVEDPDGERQEGQGQERNELLKASR